MDEQTYTEVSYRVLKIIESEPAITQRALAERLGVSVGKVNYCLKALMEKGLIKSTNFKNSSRKIQYMYVLTPRGVRERLRVAMAFLRRKSEEYDEIRLDIERLTAAMEKSER
ncbi:MAG TPA: MarR family EPS-associated transcriptional regulator [Thermoanaerobaculia bacterium]|jgi:EPS-associated MarR family transcriptional regulator